MNPIVSLSFDKATEKRIITKLALSGEETMYRHILRPGTMGAGPDQIPILIQLDLNPADFVDKLRSQVTDVINAEFRRRKNYGQVMVVRKQNEREQRIQQLGLKQGTRVARRIYKKSKRNDKSEKGEMEDEVVEITPEWYVRFAGPKNPIHPSLIIRVLE